ncbi:hypothetical protein Taro_026274, partial [Colocasia esculenta]|nr:hypothetical protein [Colocasia esculenta]
NGAWRTIGLQYWEEHPWEGSLPVISINTIKIVTASGSPSVPPLVAASSGEFTPPEPRAAAAGPASVSPPLAADLYYSPSGSPDPWAVTVKIGSSAWAEGQDMAPHRRRQVRELVEQQDESDMPAQGRVQEEVSVEEFVAQPQGAPTAVAAAGGQQQQEYQPQLQQYADWFPMVEQFFRAMLQGTWQPGQATAGGHPPVPPPVADPQEEEPAVQKASGTGSTRASQRRTAVTEDRTALLERFLHLRPPMFFGECNPDKVESWAHEMERTFETMEYTEEDQVRLAVYQFKGAAHEWWRVQRQTHFQGQHLDRITWQQFLEVFHGEYFRDYTRCERRDQFHELVQGDLAVTQYHLRFVRLLRHVPHVADSEQACAERFIAGLRLDLRWGVTAHMCTTLGEVVAKAAALERETWQPQ